jgi:hypothetical protein
VLLVLLVVTVSLGTVVTVDADNVLGSVILLAREEDLEDLLCSLGVSALGIDGSAGDMRSHGVSTTVLVSHGSPGMVLGGRLGEPDITTVSSDLAGLECLDNVLGNADGSSSSVDEPSTILHVRDELLVEEALGGGVQRAIDGHDITQREHLLQRLNSSATNLLFDVGRHGLVVVVEHFHGVEGLASLEDTLADSAATNGTDDLTLEIVGVLGDSSNIPAARDDLLVGGDKVSDQNEHSHDNMLSDGLDIRTSDFQNSDISSVGSIEINVVRAHTGSDADLELLGLVDSLLVDVARVEGGSDDYIGVNNLLVKHRVGAILGRGGNESMALRLEPVSDTELVLGASKELGLILSVRAGIIENKKDLHICSSCCGGLCGC